MNSIKSFLVFALVAFGIVSISLTISHFSNTDEPSCPTGTEIDNLKGGVSISSWVDPDTGAEYLIVSRYRGVSITPRIRP